jgi:hypothetical protein
MPTQVAHSGSRSGLSAIAPTTRIGPRVSSPKSAITPAQAMKVRYSGTACAYCRDAIASSDQVSAPSPHAAESAAGDPTGRWLSRWTTEISSPGTPHATSSGSSASTIRGVSSAVISTRSPSTEVPPTMTWSTPSRVASSEDTFPSVSLGA